MLQRSACATAQSQTQSGSHRQVYCTNLESGQLPEAILLGQQAVSRWPRDAQLRHYLGVAYFKTGDSSRRKEQLARARELNPKDSATHFDLALVLLSEQDYAGRCRRTRCVIKLRSLECARAHAAGASLSEFESQPAGD